MLGDCSDRRVRQVRALFDVQAREARAPGLNLGDEGFFRNGRFRLPMCGADEVLQMGLLFGAG